MLSSTRNLNYEAGLRDKETDSLYIHPTNRPSVDSGEVADGVALDFDSNGILVEIEI